jgi:predicted AAA+ superfamily ATPase
LLNLFNQKLEPLIVDNTTLEQLIYLTVRGGWPASIGVDSFVANELASSYLTTVIQEDMYKVDGIKRDYLKTQSLLRSLARNETTVVTNAKLAADMQSYDGESVSREALGQYLDVLSRLFILEDQPAFSSNLRSSKRTVKAPKRHFTDPSLAVAALGVNASRLLQDLNAFGFLFEALCERDLRIYAEAHNGQLFHYRDYAGHEVDAVVELPDGRWGAFEIKLGANQIDKAAAQLLAMKDTISDKEPAFLCVICGLTNMAYTREDGVMVVPITALKW